MQSVIIFLLYGFYTAASVAGLILLKQNLANANLLISTGDFFAVDVLLVGAGAALYIGSFGIWLMILARNELSVAYPAAIGLTLAFSTIVARVVLNEPLSIGRVFGIFVVFIGISVIARS